MALFEMHVYSEMLGIQTTVNIVIPQRSTIGEIGIKGGTEREKYKCLYLLHGLSDDYSTWLRRTSIERYAQEYGICVVMPSGDRSFYTDMKYGGHYYSYVSQELPKLIQDFFPVSDRREDNYIAGLSMGGYGALKIGMKNGERFSAAAGLSSVADMVEVTEVFKETYIPIFGGDGAVPDSENLFRIAEEKKADPVKPRIFIGIGTEDDLLYKGNGRLRDHLKNLGYDCTYRESKGTHNWAFWDEYIQYVLKWLFPDK